MSSLAASRADNFYHDPNWDPSKESRKKFQGSKGHNQYETDGIIRFELPIDGFCEGCERHFGKGTRWNAKKLPDGNYLSTKKWKFEFACKSCPKKFVIATDPKNSDYEYRTGIRKKIEEPDDIHGLDDVSAVVQGSLDAQYHVGGHAAVEAREAAQSTIAKLEQDQDQKRRIATEGERHACLVELGQARRAFDFDANAALRQQLRAKKCADADAVAAGKALGLFNGQALAPDAPAEAAMDAAFAAAAVGPADALRQSNAAAVAERAARLKAASGSVFGQASQLHEKSFGALTTVSRVPALAAAARAVVVHQQQEQQQQQEQGQAIMGQRKRGAEAEVGRRHGGGAQQPTTACAVLKKRPKKAEGKAAASSGPGELQQRPRATLRGAGVALRAAAEPSALAALAGAYGSDDED